MSPPPRRLPVSTPFVLRLAYEQADFKMVRTHWNKNFVRKFLPGEPVHFLMARVLHQIRADGYVIRDQLRVPVGGGHHTGGKHTG